MTEQELAAIEARAQATTPGPWTVYRCSYVDEYGAEPGTRACGLNGESFDYSRDECHHPLPLVDATFIAAARNTDIPDLVAEVRRLQGLVGRWIA